MNTSATKANLNTARTYIHIEKEIMTGFSHCDLVGYVTA